MAGRSAKHGLGIACAIVIPAAGLAAGVLLGLPEDVEPRVILEKETRPPLRAEIAMEAAEVEPDPAMARARVRGDGGSSMDNVGAIGSLRAATGSWNGPTSPYGGSAAPGQDPMSALGSLMGDQIGDSYGFGGLGLQGTGRGAGGTGNGATGIGSLGTIGHGGGGHGGGGSGARRHGRGRVPPASRIGPPPADPTASGEGYAHVAENPFVPAADSATSTFSIDVDTASYTNVRRMLGAGALPPEDAVRVEEMLNYFDHGYAAPTTGSDPFAVHTEVGACPWAPEHRLLQVGIQGRRLDQRDVPRRNLVFLVDVSGSMSSPDKLPLLVSAMGLLADNLRASDRVAIVVYAGAAGLVLPSTPGSDQETIRDALASLSAGGSTNGGEGIQLAYRVAQQHFIDNGINRVILATDGDFNVGVTGDAELTALIEARRRTGVFLTVLGFGTGNLQDHRMEQLADRGNGNYAYVDGLAEARRVLVREAGGTLWTIAQDVKIQLEFDPARVREHRLIGYENRLLRREDFEDDTVDAGEVGAGHGVTALYEIVPAGDGGNLGTVGVRYQPPGGGSSVLISRRVVDAGRAGSARLRFASAVAGFGLLLRRSEHRGDLTVASLERLAEGAVGPDPHGHRAELRSLIRRAGALGLR